MDSESETAATEAAPVPARRVMEMIELALHASFSRFPAIAALALPLFVLVFVPSALSNWLGYRAAAEVFSNFVGSFSMQNFDPNALRFYLEGNAAVPEVPGMVSSSISPVSRFLKRSV